MWGMEKPPVTLYFTSTDGALVRNFTYSPAHCRERSQTGFRTTVSALGGKRW